MSESPQTTEADRIIELERRAMAYSIRVTRTDFSGRQQVIEFDSYGVLRELLDDIEDEVERRGWIKESDRVPTHD